MADKKYTYLKIFFDGGSRGNPGPSAVGAVIYDENGKKIDELSEYIGKTTNNIAEYTALDMVLDLAGKYSSEKIVLLTDSKLIYNQVRKIWKIKDENILKIFLSVSKKLTKYKTVDMRFIPREENREADKLVNKALEKTQFSYEGESDIRFGSIEE